MTFGNMFLSPSDRLNDLFKKNPDGVEVQTIASILEQSRDLVKKRLNDLSIGATKTGKNKKKYIYLSPEGVEVLIKSFIIIDNTKKSTENIIKIPELAEETRMIFRNAMKKYGITKWQWTEMARSHASLFATTHINSQPVYYVTEENIQAFEEVIKAKKELKSKSKK